jgi:hypothetical protein
MSNRLYMTRSQKRIPVRKGELNSCWMWFTVDDAAMKFADRLQAGLKNQNLAKVSRELGIPKTLLHDWVQGNREPSLKSIRHLNRLADYLSISLEELLTGKKAMDEVDSVTFNDADRKYRIRIERVN